MRLHQVVGFAGMCPWKVGDLGVHTSFLLVQSNILSAPVPVQLTGRTLKDSTKASENCWNKVPSGIFTCYLGM